MTPALCVFFALLLSAMPPPAHAQASGPSRVADCQPCKIRIAPELPEYHFTFQLATKPGNRRLVESIRVSTGEGGSPLQTLPVHDMAPLPKTQQFFFGGVDINFDGYLDLLLVTSQGVANSYADYWLFEPSKKEFTYLGRYPIFKVDADRQRLSTYERGGHGGLVYDAHEYAFVDAKLTPMRFESQTATSHPNVFLKVVRENVNGKLEIVREEKVTAKAPAPPK